MVQQKDIKKELQKALDDADGTKSKPIKKHYVPLLAFSTILIALSLLYIFFMKTPFVVNNTGDPIPILNTPTGKITHPHDQSIISRKIIVKGYTENISPKTPYIWLTVDVSSIGLCWPKLTTIKANKKFRTEILEEGPNRSYMLSLYAVDQKTHDEILEWFEENKRLDHNAGFSMIPNRYKLDSVLLELHDI